MNDAARKTGSASMILLKTIAALVLSILAYTAAFLIVSGVTSLFYTIMTVIRPTIIFTIGSAAGAYAGVFASRYFCDRWLSGYAPKAVFILFAIVTAIGLFTMFAVDPVTIKRMPMYISSILTPLFAYIFFWKYEEL